MHLIQLLTACKVAQGGPHVRGSWRFAIMRGFTISEHARPTKRTWRSGPRNGKRTRRHHL